MKELGKGSAFRIWYNATGDYVGGDVQNTETNKIMMEDIDFILRYYWGDGRGASELIVTLDGELGLMLNYVIDLDWFASLIDDKFGIKMPDERHIKALHAANKAAATFFSENIANPHSNNNIYSDLEGATVVYANAEEDDDEDSIGLFLPLEALTKKPKMLAFLVDSGISDFGNLVYETVAQNLDANLK